MRVILMVSFGDLVGFILVSKRLLDDGLVGRDFGGLKSLNLAERKCSRL